MKISEEKLTQSISKYGTIIKNPRNWRMYRNFVSTQADIKIKQHELMKKRIPQIYNITNPEDKICFCTYILFQFPELAEKIRKFPQYQKQIREIAEHLKDSNDNKFDPNNKIVTRNMNSLFKSIETPYFENSNEANIPEYYKKKPSEEEFLSFIEQTYMDVPTGLEWDFFMLNNILTTTNMLLIQQTYSNNRDSNIDKTLKILNNNWNHYFQSVDEYMKYILISGFDLYNFIKIFVECNQDIENPEIISKYQKEALTLLVKWIQNERFLNIFVEQIMFKMYMATDLGEFARSDAKILEKNRWNIAKEEKFYELFNQIIQKNWRIMQSNQDDNKLYSLLISTCRYNNTLLKLFHIPTAVKEYMDDRKINKALWSVGPLGQFSNEDQKNISQFPALTVELKYRLSLMKEKESEYQFPDQLSKVRIEKKLIQVYDIINTNNPPVYIRRQIIGELIRKAEQVLRDQKNKNYINPVLEGLESIALMIMYLENQETQRNSKNENTDEFILQEIQFPRIVIELIRSQTEPINKIELKNKISQTIFLDKTQDQMIKDLIQYKEKLRPKEKESKRNTPNKKETIKRAVKYLFENVDYDEQSNGQIGTGHFKTNATQLFYEEITTEKQLKTAERKYKKIFKQNKDKILTMIIIIGNEFGEQFVEKTISMREAATERVAFIDESEFS